MVDIIIKSGTLLDGSGAPRYLGDVAIKDGLIVDIAKKIDYKAQRIIDASGLYITPGFIDTHSHADKIVLFDNSSYNALEQGITFQLMGQCGESPAPYSPGQMLAIENTVPKEEFDRVKAITDTPESFIAEAESHNYGVNIAFLIGHQALRAYGVGYDDVKPTQKQMAAMEEMLERAMKSGYWGMSTGLVYAPSVYADTAELVRLSKVAARHNGIYASHIRGEGFKVMDAVDEAIAIGRESGARVLISHLKVMGEQNKGKSKQLLEKIDRANEAGVFVYADQYPFDAGSAPLITQIPPKYLQGGISDAVERLKDVELRRQMLYSIFNEVDEYESCLSFSGFEKTEIAEAPYTPEHIGKTITQLAEEQGKEPFDAYCDLLIVNKGDAQGIYLNQNMEDICRIMVHPHVFAGCDWAEYTRYHEPNEVGGGHPRGTGTMTRRLEIMRNYDLCSAENAISSITGRPAAALGIPNRGILKAGYAADICIIDYPNISCTADYKHPFAKNKGLEYVLVNGQIALENGTITGRRAGVVVKHNNLCEIYRKAEKRKS